MKIILSFLSLFVASVAFAQDVKTQQDSIASAKKAKELIAAFDAHVPVDQIEDRINLRR